MRQAHAMKLLRRDTATTFCTMPRFVSDTNPARFQFTVNQDKLSTQEKSDNLRTAASRAGNAFQNLDVLVRRAE